MLHSTTSNGRRCDCRRSDRMTCTSSVVGSSYARCGPAMQKAGLASLPSRCFRNAPPGALRRADTSAFASPTAVTGESSRPREAPLCRLVTGALHLCCRGYSLRFAIPRKRSLLAWLEACEEFGDDLSRRLWFVTEECQTIGSPEAQRATSSPSLGRRDEARPRTALPPSATPPISPSKRSPRHMASKTSTTRQQADNVGRNGQEA
jgi:hypothetical protein